MIPPGSVLGIIGGGQLGRMLAIAAAELGYKIHVFTPEKDAPASQVAWRTTRADYTDAGALRRFAEGVQAITFEFENIPHESLELLERYTVVRPGASVLKVCRNRLREKNFLRTLGIPTTEFRACCSRQDLLAGLKALGTPAVLKTTELGYDGKGQATLRTAEDAEAAWEKLGAEETILEAFVNFRMEISVIVARRPGGEMRVYPAVKNIHRDHILHRTIAPAPVTAKLAREAEAVATRIAQALLLEGLLAVEMFVTRQNEILVNELAPRPHNSGHWTMDACATGQFEQAVRAVCDLPLGNPSPLCAAEMRNLIGDEAKDWEVALKDENAKLHLYGKREIRPGRKMGHVTTLK